MPMETVEVLKSELVVPAETTPSEAIWLSNLDVAERHGYTPTVYFYRPNVEPGFSAADVIKDSLARALVTFYPLAGRLGLDGAGRVQVDCTGEGAVFVTARSGYVLDDLLNDFVPCPEMRDLFVPATPTRDPPCALLLVQVTYLRCGGVVLGLATHHALVDAGSAAIFVDTWASVARGDTAHAAVTPCFDHSLLAARPRRAVLYDHPEYKPELEPVDAVAASTYASAIITLSKAQVTALKTRCAGASTFRAVVALVWQCVCRARVLPDDAETRLYCVIDMRARLAPPLPPGYFGNAVVRTSVSAKVAEVVSSPVGDVARRALAVTSQGDDYARSLVDYLEEMGAMNLTFRGPSRAHLRAVSWMGMSLHDSDFGWGAPVFMGRALMNSCSYVYVMPGPENDGAVVLTLSLEPETMPEFRKLFADELTRLEQ